MPYSFFFILFLIWHLSIVIDGRAFSNWLPGPIFVNIHWSLYLCPVWVLWVRSHHVGSLCRVCGTQCMCCVEVIFNVFSFFCLLCDNGRKDYHNCFITTPTTYSILDLASPMSDSELLVRSQYTNSVCVKSIWEPMAFDAECAGCAQTVVIK